MSNKNFAVTTDEAPRAIADILHAGLVPMLHGSPGVAKSSIAQQLAAEKNLKVIDLRLSQCDPTDLAGFPFMDRKTNKATYRPMDTFPIKGDSLPVDKNGNKMNGWLLLLDEFNSAPMAVQAAAYKLVLDRQVGQHELHDNVFMVAAGNLASDKAIVNRLSTAMQSRVIHLLIKLTPKAWVDWANANNIDHRVVAFINFKPDLLHRFDPDHDDLTFPCARTWEFTSKIIKRYDQLERRHLPIITGTVGEGAGNEFFQFSKIYKEMVTIEEILKDPKKATLPEEPSIQFAVTGIISYHMNEQNCKKLFQYITRLPLEFQVTCLRACYRRFPELEYTSEWDNWTAKNAKALF